MVVTTVSLQFNCVQFVPRKRRFTFELHCLDLLWICLGNKSTTHRSNVAWALDVVGFRRLELVSSREQTRFARHGRVSFIPPGRCVIDGCVDGYGMGRNGVRRSTAFTSAFRHGQLGVGRLRISCWWWWSRWSWWYCSLNWLSLCEFQTVNDILTRKAALDRRSRPSAR